MVRKFVYDGKEFPDPDPEMSVEEVQRGMAGFYGELDNASCTETQDGEDTVYEFQRRVGTKGALETAGHSRGPGRRRALSAQDPRAGAGTLGQGRRHRPRWRPGTDGRDRGRMQAGQETTPSR